MFEVVEVTEETKGTFEEEEEVEELEVKGIVASGGNEIVGTSSDKAATSCFKHPIRSSILAIFTFAFS